jgi:hypothetical protein
VCGSAAQAIAAIERAGASRVAPYLDGISVNVMGAVGAHGSVMVLPPTRQLLDLRAGRPIYAGNTFAGVPDGGSRALVDAARRAGHELAARGYLGAFGLDAIVDGTGRLVFHDLNARVNGAVHAFDLHFPALAGLLAAAGWVVPDLVTPAEAEVQALVAARPVARWQLTQIVTDPTPLQVPRPGLYRIDPDGGRAVHLDEGHHPDEVGGDTVLVRSRAVPARPSAGHVITVADLWCDATFGLALEQTLGAPAATRLVDLLRGAGAT